MGIKVVSDSFGLINAGLTFALVVISAGVILAFFRKSTFETLKQGNEALKSVNDALDTVTKQQKDRLEKIEAAYHAQEKRIYRVEIAAKRSDRKLNQAREEIRILELAINVAVPCLAGDGAHVKEHTKIIKLLAELSEFRQKSNIEQDEWEDTQTTTIAFMDARHEPAHWEHKSL